MVGKRHDLGKRIQAILQHAEGLPPEAAAPHAHYLRTVDDLQETLLYLEAKVLKGTSRSAIGRRHLGRFRRMMLIHLIESFERFLKEVAAVCVDSLGQYVLDDRFNAFKVQGSSLAAHFGTDTLGRSLCESIVWLDCDEINARFRKLLADPFEDGNFLLFPKLNQQPSTERGRYELLGLVWQLRHTMVHNVGVITQSDAIKLRLLVKASVMPNCVLAPTKDDLRYLRQFLDDTVGRCNERVGPRLAELLTTIHADNPILFTPQDMADRLTQKFGTVLTVAGIPGTPPPP